MLTKETIAMWYLRIRNAEKRPTQAANAIDPIVSLPYTMATKGPRSLCKEHPYNLNASYVHA
jgi:hypothetical protein